MRELHEDPFYQSTLEITENARRLLLPEHIIINEGNARRPLLSETL